MPPEIDQAAEGRPGEGHEARATSKQLRDYYLQNVCADTKTQLAAARRRSWRALRQQRDEFDAAIPSTFVFNDLPKPRDSFVMLRGAVRQAGREGRAGDARVPAAAEEGRTRTAARRGSTWRRWLVVAGAPADRARRR